MSQRIFSLVVGTIFSLVAILHGLRIIYDWEVIIGSLLIPIWVSYFGFVVAGFLAYLSFKSK